MSFTISVGRLSKCAMAGGSVRAVESGARSSCSCPSVGFRRPLGLVPNRKLTTALRSSSVKMNRSTVVHTSHDTTRAENGSRAGFARKKTCSPPIGRSQANEALGILPRHCSLPDGTPPPQIDRPPPAHVDAILNHYGAEGYCSASNIR